MKAFYRLAAAFIAFTMSMAIPCARGATPVNHGYFFKADSEGKFDCVSEAKFPEESSYRNGSGYVIENIDLSGMKSPVLRVWYTPSGMPITTAPLQYMYIKTGNSDKWRKITVNQKLGYAIIPSEAVSLGFAYFYNSRGTLNYITISESPEHAEDICISDLNLNVRKGTVLDDGTIVADDGNSVEVSLSHPDLNSFSTGYGDFCWMNSGRNSSQSKVDIAVTASTPEGDVEIYRGSAKAYASQRYTWPLPANMSEINFRFVFGEGDSGSIKFSSVDGKTENDMCVGIFETGHGGNLLPDIYFDYLPSGADYAWYDIDGDGVKEWARQYKYKRSVNRFNYDLMGESVIDAVSVDQWKNYDREGISAVSSQGIYDWDGDAFQEALTFDKEVKVIDFNNDGKNDFLDGKSKQLISYSPMGEFSKSPVRFLSPQEYYDYLTEHKGSGLGSGMSVIGGGEGTPGSFGSFSYVDINNDGYIDYIDGANGEYLMNVGDGRFVKDSFAGRVIFRDFNGDGVNDMIAYDSSTKTLSLVIQNKEGEAKKIKLIGGFKCSDYIWCRDFDGDGDIDIVVPFDSDDNNGQSYIVTFENKGDASFKKKEYYIDGFVNFRNCSDNDNDGNYEILGYSAAYASTYSRDMKLVQFRMEGLNVRTDATTLRSEKYISSDTSGILVGDIDNSGKMRVILNDSIMVTSDRLNTRPDRPGAPKLNIDTETGDLVICWDMGSDKETSAVDLTYELRIGTAPDKCDILWSDALPSGMRRNFLQGNCGYSRERRIATSSWPMGKIYVSVQAIDDNGMGSEFSEYTIFEKSSPAADFLVETQQLCAVTDETIIRVNISQEDGVRYEWDFDGGEIKENDSKKYTIVWSTPGIKEVNLKAIAPDGSSSSITHEVEVVPARLIKGMRDAISDAVDLDLDGKYELLSQKFLAFDENGEYTPLKRLFNNNMTTGYEHKIVDINRDGLPDLVYSSHNGYGTYYLGQFINEGDGYMEPVDKVVTKDYYSFEYDLDNDGLADAYGLRNTDGYLRNTGDYLNYVEVNDAGFDSKCYWYDYDGDGLIDKICHAGTGINGMVIKIFKNKGNFVFEEIESLDLKEDRSGFDLGDMDGDGKMDIAWNLMSRGTGTSYSDFTYVRWSDGTISAIPAPSGHQFDKISDVFDFDNNGCMDLLISLDYNSQTGRDYVIVFFNADHTWQIVNLGNDLSSEINVGGTVPYRRGDGRLGYGNKIIVTSENQRPGVPADVKATQNDDAVVIEWTAPEDLETPSAALRYNISIKHKDKGGEGAYFWSPMNGALNGVPVPSSAQLLVAPRLTLPNGVIAPGEYEVKVQALDTQMEAGDFSEVFILKVSEGNLVSGPAETMVGQATEFRMTSGYTSSDFDFGEGAQIVEEKGSVVWVRWTSEGEKTIRKGEFSKVVMVHPALNAYFKLPSEVIVGAKVRLECDNLHNSEWRGLQLRDFESYMPLSSHYITFTVIDDTHAEMIFRQSVTPRGIQIRHTLTEPYGSDEYSTVVTTKVINEKPSISAVDRDLTSGAPRLSWTMPAQLSGIADGVRIYKESDEFGKYDLLTTLPLGASSFTDMSDGSNAESRRYRLSFNLPYGETEMSASHKALGLSVATNGSGSVELSWDPYEGREVKSYRVMRGTSLEDLSCIKELQSSASYYVDPAPLAVDAIYVLEAVLSVGGEDLTVHSNSVMNVGSSVGWLIEDGAPCDIYNVAGELLKKDADVSDIENLSSGIYIIRQGEKITKLLK